MCKPVKCPQCGHEFTPERDKSRSGAWTPDAGIFTPSEYDDEAEENETAGGTVPKPGERLHITVTKPMKSTNTL